MNDIGSIENSPFDRTKPLRVMTHGWYGDDTTDLITGASRVLLDHYDFNVLVIDWGEGAQTINYIAAVQRVRPVGVFVASYLDFLHANGLIDYNRVSLIGFSLGGNFDKSRKFLIELHSEIFLPQLTSAASSGKAFNAVASTQSSDLTQPGRFSVSATRAGD